MYSYTNHIKKAAVSSCQEKIDARKFCYADSSEPKGGENCLTQELDEKKCLAENLCVKEAAAFYGGAGVTGVCSLWAESFAYASKSASVAESIKLQHIEGREIVRADRRKETLCREHVMNLSKCMAKFSPFDAEDI